MEPPRRSCIRPNLSCLMLLLSMTLGRAGVGDPQVGTDHDWYPGEWAFSNFERLFEHQAEVYRRVVGVRPRTDEEKAVASWLWRNTHYWHGEEGAEDLWGQGFTKGGDYRTRDYWTGLFAHGFGLCGTTHSQWTAEMEYLLGHARSRGVGVEGHNSFEVFLQGGPYDKGRWALLDHDVSTVVYGDDPPRLLSIREVQAGKEPLAQRASPATHQRGWLPCGLHPDDGRAFSRYDTAEYFAGYAGPPPMVHLRRGERLKRFFQPGLEDGKTFVFWGRNYETTGIAGPERAMTWVNQPEKMYRSQSGAGYRPGQARFANAVYVYRPDFGSADYKEGVVSEDDRQVTFEFYSPYIIAATPPNQKPWGIYDAGGRNGLVISGTAPCVVAISVDQGKSWSDCGMLSEAMDLTDRVKGYRQYWVRLGASAEKLRASKLTMRTVCQANSSILPRLREEGSNIRFRATGTAVLSAGPTRAQAQAHVVAGGFDTAEVTLELSSPRQSVIRTLYAAAHWASGNPPDERVRYKIDYSLDGGRTWKPGVNDWNVQRRKEEPPDFWSQSFCYGAINCAGSATNTVQVRFQNTGGKKVLRAEGHLVYEVGPGDPVRVTYEWTDDRGAQTHSHLVRDAASSQWLIPTGRNVQSGAVELEVAR